MHTAEYQKAIEKIKKFRFAAFILALFNSVFVLAVIAGIILVINGSEVQEDSDPIKPCLIAFVAVIGALFVFPCILLTIITWFWYRVATVLGFLLTALGLTIIIQSLISSEYRQILSGLFFIVVPLTIALLNLKIWRLKNSLRTTSEFAKPNQPDTFLC